MSLSQSRQLARVGVAIGDWVVDMALLADAGCFMECRSISNEQCFHQGSLNSFMSLGKTAWQEVRATIQALLIDKTGLLADPDAKGTMLVSMGAVEMLLPAVIGDFTDFYASKEHATKVGTMFRSAEDALAPNWIHLPVAYHGRSSSIVPSGTAVRRPHGQIAPKEESEQPSYGPSAVVDFELEMGFLIGCGNELGHPIDIQNVGDHIFGMVLLNDWSARDVQKWEYVPLGPFNSKNWATTISPWVVTMEALQPFRCAAPEQKPSVLSYLQDPDRCSYDIGLEASIRPKDSKEATVISRSNLRHLYWTASQMVAHHTAGGCNLRSGDLLGTGTISCTGNQGQGCLLEATSGGTTPVQLSDGTERVFLQDGDTVELSGFCQGEGYRVGFGVCCGQLLSGRDR